MAPHNKIELPDYTAGEERLNSISHLAGVAVGAVILVLGILKAGPDGPWAMTGAVIYGVSMMLLYAVSGTYHGLKKCTAKKVLRICDHCTIYLLIAGTYAPILLAGIRPQHPVTAWVLFGAEWALAAAGAAFTAADLKKFGRLSMACYLVMGWGIVVVLRDAVQAMTWAGFLWLIGGGVAYTVGAVLYGLGKKRRYIHSVFHFFVLAGSILQAVGILQYVL